MSTDSTARPISNDVAGVFPPAPTLLPIVTLTAEQIAAKAIELRDPAGKLIGVLFRDGETSIYYSPERLAELERQAANPEPGRPLRQFLDTLADRVAQLPQRTGA